MASLNLTVLEGKELQKIQDQLPDVVLVKKIYPKRRKANKKRIWKLKRLEIDKMEENKTKDRAIKKEMDEDIDRFMEDLEENPQLREQINLYPVI